MTTKMTLYTRHKPQLATKMRIVDAIKAFGDRPFSAPDIARQLGRNALYASDRTVLYRLVEDGILEQQLTQVQPTLVARYLYRVISKLPETTD